MQRKGGERSFGGLYSCEYMPTSSHPSLRKLEGVIVKLEPLSDQHALVRFLCNVDNAKTLGGFVQELADSITDYQVRAVSPTVIFTDNQQVSVQQGVYERTREICDYTKNMRSGTKDLLSDTKNILGDTKNIHSDTKNIRDDTKNLLSDSKNICDYTRNLHNDTRNILVRQSTT
jgi:hypothetical protein